MRVTALLTALGAFITVSAIPTKKSPFFKRADSASMPTDTQVLQYALTLEHLESAFYTQALNNFTQQDFLDAGFPAWVRGRVEQVSMHEKEHVIFLSSALGDNNVPACEYSFPYTDVKSFLVMACALENVGVSAYLGAAQYISDPDYLTAAAAITTVEARHQGFFYAPVLKQAAWTGPFDTPLGLDMVYTLASQLITSCPYSNVSLPVMASAPLLVMSSPITGNAQANSTVTVSYDSNSTVTAYAAVYNGLGSTVVPLDNMSFELPDVQGYSYIIITSASKIADITMDNIIAGPAEVQTSFDSYKSNPGFMNP